VIGFSDVERVVSIISTGRLWVRRATLGRISLH
jgi:hypothetical protein